MACEVEDHNRKHPREEPVVNPSPELIQVVLQFLSWYHLFRRRNPPMDEEDIKDMRTMAKKVIICDYFCIFLSVLEYF